MEIIDKLAQESDFVLFFGGTLLFFIIRELFTWYWKMNRVVDALENIEVSLRKIEDKLMEKPSA